MNLSCHAFSPADFVLADPARADEVSVSACARGLPAEEGNISFLSVLSDDVSSFSLDVCPESPAYRTTGKTLRHTLTVVVCVIAIPLLTAVRTVLDAVHGFGERVALYLRDRRFRC